MAKKGSEELIIEAKSFFETYRKQIGESIRKGRKVIFINFDDVSSVSPELAESIITSPEEIMQLLETALEETGLLKNPRIRFNDIPETQKVKIRTIRAQHLNQLIYFEGLVRQASEVRPQVVNAKFECPACGTVISVLQVDKKFREPSRCSCGRKGQFNLLSKAMVDAQRLVIEEAPESLTGGEQPRRMAVFLKEDLVEPWMEEKTTPGSKIRILGVLKEVPIPLQTGAISTRFDLAVEANNIIGLETTYEELDISEEDERQIEELAEDPELFFKLRDSVAPSIWGYDEIKEALVLQMFGGVRKVSPDGTVTRGDIHLFLMGDPGVAKSVTLKFVSNIAPKGRYIVGKAASIDYNEPLLIKDNGMIRFEKIGSFVDEYYNGKETGFVDCNNNIEALSFNKETLKLEWKPIRAVFRHKRNDKLLNIKLESGRRVCITNDHSIFCLRNMKIQNVLSSELKKGDYVIVPKEIKSENNLGLSKDLARLLGYFIAEGHLNNSKGSYKIQFTINKIESDIIKDLKNITIREFNKKISIKKHGENSVRLTIYGKESYYKICELLGSCKHKKAKEKSIPEIIFNSDNEIQEEFFQCYMRGDAGVTKSERLMNDLLYLRLFNKQIISCLEREDSGKSVMIEGRKVNRSGRRFDIIAPEKRKIFENRKVNFPIDALDKDLRPFFKRMVDQGYRRIKSTDIDKRLHLSRLCYLYEKTEVKGKELRKIFGENSLEYFNEHLDWYKKKKIGRDIYYSLTKNGRMLGKRVNYLKKLVKSDLAFLEIKDIEKKKSISEFVYDISTPENENFVAGFGGVVCHNTGAGITATVVKDEFLKGWSLEAGAMVLANKGIVCIDEIEKMDATDRSAMHEALEQQTVTISKANVQASLSAQTSVLAAGNPKFGRFEPQQSIADQIDLPPALINRFDLIFIQRDLPDQTQDKEIAQHVLNIHQRKDKKSAIEPVLFRKYVAYAKQKIEPVLSDEAADAIKDFYVKMRVHQGTEGGISISARQLQGLVRLAEAHAKTRLSSVVERVDTDVAIKLTKYYLMQVGYDPETKTFDIDRFTTGTSKSKRGKIFLVKETIKKLELEYGKQVPIDLLRKELNDLDDEEFETAIQELIKKSDIFEPKAGFVQIM